MTTHRSSYLIAFCAFAAFLIAGCANTSGTGGDLDTFLSEVRRTQRDYSPTSGPKELAGLADLTVYGKIVGAEPGQLYAPLPDEPPMISTTVLAIDLYEVLGGDPTLVQDGMVFVEIAHPAFVGTKPEAIPDEPGNGQSSLVPYDTSAFASQVPLLEGVFFLGDRTEEPYWESVIDVGAGRPDGSHLFAAYTEGFLVESVSGELIGAIVPLAEMHDGWTGMTSIKEVIAALD